MADYNPILDAETDPEAGLRSSLFKRMVANPEASFEGKSGAYRLRIGALQRLTAGDEIRSRVDGETTGNGTHHSFAFLQAGTVRCSLNHRSTSVGSTTANINRVRNGVSTTVATWSTSSTSNTARTADIDVLPGDLIQFAKQGGTTAAMSSARISTDGEDLFPAGSYPVEGNTYA